MIPRALRTRALRPLAFRSIALLLCLVSLVSVARAQWTPPTEEELTMTSQPEVPGAPAVILFREEITEDNIHMWSVYVRLKVLTEAGKERANVELRQYQVRDHGGYTVGDIAGRTIHPDGTIIPFTGKPYEKLLEKSQGYTEKAKVFTLPDVEVGSIIEYRYKLRYDEDFFSAPDWYIQSDLYTRKAHYLWHPTSRQLVTSDEDGGQLTSGIAWTPILPPDANFKHDDIKAFELSVHDIPPSPSEEFMPPIESLSYRVLFYYTPYHSAQEFWTKEGKRWSKSNDKFIGPGPKVNAAVEAMVAPSDSQDQKLRKIYAAIMQLENTVCSRDRSAAEEKAQGLGQPKNTDDILERKRGSDDELTQLFVAMARAAGMKAYVMRVTSRDSSLFLLGYFSLRQLNDNLAVVNVDGKEQFFDPGQRYCPYGHLAWKHTMVQGLRQIDGGTTIAQTPPESYKSSRIQRVADLVMDERGAVAGVVTLTLTGAPALHWRHVALSGDETSLRRDLKTEVEHMMPNGMEVRVEEIEKLEEYEQPLRVNFYVQGAIGSATGKRLVFPGDLFESNVTPTFPHEKREVPICFEYPSLTLDAVRVAFPKNLTLESAPTAQKTQYKTSAFYALSSESTPTSVTVRREFDIAEILFPATEYPELRAFYNKFETKDQESAVLKVIAPSAGN